MGDYTRFLTLEFLEEVCDEIRDILSETNVQSMLKGINTELNGENLSLVFKGKDHRKFELLLGIFYNLWDISSLPPEIKEGKLKERKLIAFIASPNSTPSIHFNCLSLKLIIKLPRGIDLKYLNNVRDLKKFKERLDERKEIEKYTKEYAKILNKYNCLNNSHKTGDDILIAKFIKFQVLIYLLSLLSTSLKFMDPKLEYYLRKSGNSIKLLKKNKEKNTEEVLISIPQALFFDDLIPRTPTNIRDFICREKQIINHIEEILEAASKHREVEEEVYKAIMDIQQSFIDPIKNGHRKLLEEFVDIIERLISEVNKITAKVEFLIKLKTVDWVNTLNILKELKDQFRQLSVEISIKNVLVKINNKKLEIDTSDLSLNNIERYIEFRNEVTHLKNFLSELKEILKSRPTEENVGKYLDTIENIERNIELVTEILTQPDNP
jgi:ribosomal protein S18